MTGIQITILISSLILTGIIALNNFFGLKDRFRNYLKKRLEIPTEQEKLNQKRIDSDRDLYEKIKLYLNSDVNMMEIRDKDFGGSFRDNLTEDLRSFVWECKKPEFEFHNEEIENAKKKLTMNLQSFLSAVGQYTFTNEVNPEFRSVPKDWIHRLPDKHNIAIKTLNSSADLAIEAYDSFIRKCKKELLI